MLVSLRGNQSTISAALKKPQQIRRDGSAFSRTFQFSLRSIWKTIELMQSKINIPRSTSEKCGVCVICSEFM